jgi:hypothetical protein
MEQQKDKYIGGDDDEYNIILLPGLLITYLLA